MKIKIVNLVVALVVFFGLIATSAYAGTFSDNFNDNNADGWISENFCVVCGLGTWRVIDGVLIEDSGGDDYQFLVDNLSLSNQLIETKILFHDNGYAGFTLWHYDINNWVSVKIYPGYIQSLRVVENIDGVFQFLTYPLLTDRDRWYTMRVDANSLTGELTVYLDGIYIATHTVSVATHRTGLSGLTSGNAGGSFDDFVITSSSIVDPLTDKAQCKNDGWKVYTNPVFKNQGDCLSYVVSNDGK